MISTHPPGHVPGLARRGLFAFVLTALLGTGPAALGDSVTFAQFIELNSNPSFSYTHIANSASATFSANIPVEFIFYTPGLASDVGGFHVAQMNVNLTSNGSAFHSGGVPGVDTQPLSGTISFALGTPAAEGNGNRTNLLTITLSSTTSGLTGTTGGRSAGIALTNTGSTSVGFSSDFVNFTGTDQRNLALSFTSLSAALGISGNFLHDFSAVGSGQFADDPGPTAGGSSVSTPEPSSLILVGGLAGLSALASRLRNRAKVPAA